MFSNVETQSGVGARFNKEEVLEKIHSELENIELSSKGSFRVKIGMKFAAKNSPEQIKKTSKRYIAQEAPFRFYKESEAYDAARALNGKVEKE